MFQKRLNELLDSLQLSTSVLARYAGIERTIISRFRSGARVPSASTDSLQKIVKGLVLAVEQTGQNSELYEMVGAASEDGENLEKIIYQYLTENANDRNTENNKKKKSTQEKGSVLGERLRNVMNLAAMSNVRLSKALNVDASLISRYCSGSRTPRSNPQIMKEMGMILFEKIITIEKQEELCQMMGIGEKDLNEISFTNWLFQTKIGRENIVEVARKMIYSLESFSAASMKQNLDLNPAVYQNTLQDTRSVYVGTEGLRQACIRLLTQAVSSGGRELWLYSDFDIAWMVEDKEFWLTWSVLMAACVQNKIHIHIVHQLNRRMDEMLNAISGWLPLYMSGMVDSYYCLANTNMVFSHAMFICPGIAAIEGFNISGMEKNGRYRFHVDEKELTFYKESFMDFLLNARPLVKVLANESEDMKKASVIIRPESILVHSETEGDQCIPISTNEFKNAEVFIGENFAAVKRLKENKVIFYITHPYMVEAFKVYAEQLLQK